MESRLHIFGKVLKLLPFSICRVLFMIFNVATLPEKLPAIGKAFRGRILFLNLSQHRDPGP